MRLWQRLSIADVIYLQINVVKYLHIIILGINLHKIKLTYMETITKGNVELVLIEKSELLSIIKDIVRKELDNFEPITIEKEDDNELVKANWIKEQYGVSLVTINMWDKKGILKPIYLGGRKFYKKSDIVDSFRNKK